MINILGSFFKKDNLWRLFLFKRRISDKNVIKELNLTIYRALEANINNKS